MAPNARPPEGHFLPRAAGFQSVNSNQLWLWRIRPPQLLGGAKMIEKRTFVRWVVGLLRHRVTERPLGCVSALKSPQCIKSKYNKSEHSPHEGITDLLKSIPNDWISCAAHMRGFAKHPNQCGKENLPNHVTCVYTIRSLWWNDLLEPFEETVSTCAQQ